jgi:DNA-binding XRE family transcriptional regulator
MFASRGFVSEEVVAVWSRPDRYLSFAHFLNALTHVMDRFCKTHDVEPMSFEEWLPPEEGAPVVVKERVPRASSFATETPFARLLADRRLSQTELARRTGVCRETINRLCRGNHDSEPQAQTVTALAYGLGVPHRRIEEALEVSVGVGLVEEAPAPAEHLRAVPS